MNKYLCILFFLIFSGCSIDKETSLIDSYDEITLRWNETVKEITFEEDLSWTISSKLPAWLAVSNMKRDGYGHVSFNIIISENDTGHNRSAELVFVASDRQKTVFITQNAKEKLRFVGEKEYSIDSESVKLVLKIERNIDYELIIPEADGKWINQANSDEINELVPSLDDFGKESYSELNLEIAENQSGKTRRAELIIHNDSFNLSDTVYVIQKGAAGRYKDGEYRIIQSSPYGSDVNLVIMGDGFTGSELGFGGNYEDIMKRAAEYFFSIEPYKSYRYYFNVYMVAAESKESGVNEKGSLRKIQNKFRSTYGEGTEITCDSELCFEYAHKIKELNDNPLTVIVVLNSTKYAGTTYLYSDGNSIALCPMSNEAPPNDFEGLIHHEAGGHGFGFLCDEYIYYNREIPEKEKKEIMEWQQLGFQRNLDFTDDVLRILWKDFIGQEKYNMVGVYEGGAQYQYGIWRSEENSCMNNNIPYYNVQSRWSIAGRIMQLSGRNLTVGDFMDNDHIEYPNAVYRSISTGTTLPLGHPKWIKTTSFNFAKHLINN